MRRKLAAGNWKMNKTSAEAEAVSESPESARPRVSLGRQLWTGLKWVVLAVGLLAFGAGLIAGARQIKQRLIEAEVLQLETVHFEGT